MKIRSGFVSNSSSSSFIIAVKNTVECSHCKRKDKNFLDIVEAVGGDGYEETKVSARGYSNVVEWIKNSSNYVYEDETERKRWDVVFEKIEKADKSGHEIGSIEISYHDGFANEELDRQLNHESVEKIWSNN